MNQFLHRHSHKRSKLGLSEIGLSAHGLILDVLDKDALSFYKKFNIFEELTNNPMRLIVGMTVLKEF